MIWFSLLLGFLSGAWAVFGPVSTPDAGFGLWQLAGTAAGFVFVWGAFFGLARYLRLRFFPAWQPAFEFPLAALASMLLAFFLGIAQLYSTAAPARIAYLALLLLGWWLGGLSWRGRDCQFQAHWSPLSKWEKSFLLLFTFAYLIRLFAALYPEAHGDPLLYHLVGPRVWVEQGGVRMHPELPNAILAASWEYHYVWPNLLFHRGQPGSGLIEAQLFNQWTHLTIGWLGALIFLVQAFARWIPALRWRLLAAFAAAFVLNIQWTAGLAKNDWGMILWGTAGLFAALSAVKRRECLLAGAWIGLALAGKPNTGFFLLPALALLPFSLGKKWFWLLPTLLLALATTALRNFLLTGNPVYPMLHHIFPNPYMSESWAEHFSLYQPTEAAFRGWAFWLSRIWLVLKESPLLWLVLLLPFSFSFFRRERSLRLLLGICAGSFLLFGLALGAFAELRHLGATLPILIFLLVALWAHFFPRSGIWAIPLGLVAVLAFSHLPLHILGKWRQRPFGNAAILHHTAGPAKAWARQQLSPAERIALVADNETYYLLGWNVTILSELPTLDSDTRTANNLRTFAQALCKHPTLTYLLDARPDQGLKRRFEQESALLRKAVVFDGGGIVYSADKIRGLFPSNPPCS